MKARAKTQSRIAEFTPEERELEKTAWKIWGERDENFRKHKTEFRAEIILDGCRRIVNGQG